MELFHRTKEYHVEWPDRGDEFLVTVKMLDQYHDIEVRVAFRYPELVIASVEPIMRRTPYPVCPHAVEQAQGCVGMRVGPGLALLLTRQIGGKEGCSHITNLVLDACHASVQGLLAIRRIAEGDRAQAMPAAEKIEFLEAHNLSVRDSCVAYSLPKD